ncbi:tetratricopeptide repeat protein [Hahella ganghwensis]|uniref:tetratricopeptide repeat protein n=1 Tax=Hahella ganghwensis TaxID=286420 RepID=UPI00037D1ADC|nr:tetratricopeptide repeat protein [Hahella ganghwensis]
MPFLILSILIQVALVVHIFKTGRNTTWIWVVVMLPMVGSIAYFIVEVLPDLGNSRSGKKARRAVSGAVNPNREIKQAAMDYSIADTRENSAALAEEMLKKGMFAEAQALFKKCLKGLYEHDPTFMFGLARAEFGLQNHAETKAILDRLIEHNPDYKNADAHLLYARTLEQTGDIEAALHEFSVLDTYFPGPEASYRYALLLRKSGETAKAQELLVKIITQANRASRHYNDLYKTWIKLARSESKGF